MTTPSLESRLNRYSPTVLSIFRIVIGFLFAVHGAAIVFGWPVDMKAPFGAWPEWWAGLIEFVTGLLVLVGLFTRPAAFLASGTMAVAYFWMHQPKALWPIENHGEPAVLFCFSFLLLVFFGPGAYAIDTRRRPLAAITPRGRFGGRRGFGNRRFARR
ncbi:MAG: DoxX family protein [Mycolicibacterium sp.]|nr:DoxX family protein [Mycolicibacterium sp.]